MPDQQGNTGADADKVADTSLHAYKDSRRQDIKGDAEKLIDSEDPKDLQASELEDPDEANCRKSSSRAATKKTARKTATATKRTARQTRKVLGVAQAEGQVVKIDSYERKNQNRTTILSRITTLRASEPWPGYDELTATEIQAVLAERDDERAAQTRSYERAHKNRAGVLKTAEREHSKA